MDVEEMLARHPLVSGLDSGHRARLAALARVVVVPVGGQLFREGDPAASAWLVVSGRVSLTIAVPGRDETILCTVGAGELLGWSALLDARRYVASGRVIDTVTLLELPRDALRALCDADHDVGYAVVRLALEEVSARLHQTRLQLLDMFAR